MYYKNESFFDLLDRIALRVIGIIAACIVGAIGLFWEEWKIDFTEQSAIFVLILSAIAIIVLLIDTIYIIYKFKNDNKKVKEILEKGKKVKGKIIKINEKFSLPKRIFQFHFSELYNLDDDYIFNLDVEFKNPDTGEIEIIKTNYVDANPEDMLGNKECEVYVYGSERYVTGFEYDDAGSVEDIERTEELGKKVEAKILSATISSKEKYVILEYKDPKTKKKKIHKHQVWFNPKRLEDNKCNLYIYEKNYYPKDFVLGDTVDYKTDKRIKITNYLPSMKDKETYFKIEDIIMTITILVFGLIAIALVISVALGLI